MESITSILIPAELSLATVVLLIASSFLTAGITTAVGIGGGLAMLAIMANVMPVAAIVPVHGVVQTTNNTSRAFLLRRDLCVPIFIWFSAGGIIGILVASQVVVTLPLNLLRMIMGVFILYSVWAPKLKNFTNGKGTLFFGGIISSAASMFIGASGPITMAFLPRSKLTHKQLVSTHAAIMVLQHGFKIFALGLLGFIYTPWIGLLIAMLVSGFAGALVGRAILWRVAEEKFKLIFNMVLTLLALRMLYQALA
jgi:uncharacterized protein